MATVAEAQSVFTRNISCCSSTSSISAPARIGISCPAAAGLRELSISAVRRRGGKATARRYKGPSALFDRGTEGRGGEGAKKPEKKFITKDEEPQQYWQTADEREGKNPMSSPLPYIVILSVLSPFIILAVAFANNWIKLPVR